jgi:hypothetical protein
MSQLFSVCSLQAESEQGKGSRFFFRLPKGVVRCLVIGIGCLSLAFSPTVATAQPSPLTYRPSPLDSAAAYADSAYYSNINGTFERTLLFADSCRNCLNTYYREQRPGSETLLLREGDTSLTPPEILWLHDSVDVDYRVILDIRNESAVAALALHEWQLYSYNNRIYTSLFKELSADATLADYCRAMQQTKENRTIAVVLLLLALLSIPPVWYFYYLRPRLNARFQAERMTRDDLELIDDELRRAEQELANLHVSNAVLDNCLSTLKHETMYYPSRIRQLIDQGDIASASEVVSYYRELYNLLSQQAMSQVERVKLHLHPLVHGILGDATLINYLFDIIKKQTGKTTKDMTFTPLDDKYIEVTVTVHSPQSSVLSPVDTLLCRQIVRDHGEATHRRGCSFQTELLPDGAIHIRILLPRSMNSQIVK